jgi:hypothetical protein
LELEEVYCPDEGLREKIGVRWGRLPGGQEIHFVPSWGNGCAEWKKQAEEMSAMDKDCTEWTPWMNNHPAWTAPDLTPIVKRMLEDKVPFFGPVKRGDGVYQVYVKVPTFTYLEVDSSSYDESLKAPTTWAEQRGRY